MNDANAAPADPLIDTRIDGRYTIRGILGQGGMGVVYDGVHDELGRSVAIKVLNTAWASDRTAVERFLREARTASSFSHGNIVDVSDLGRLPDGRPYLVMPKITGTDLNSLLGEMGPQPAKRVADLLGGVGSALDLIHAKGYVHRDIKPENLMYIVRDDGSETVMLLDFGIAKLVMSTEPRLTGQGAVFGTPHFMAPEAWGGGAPDASGDVYALATVVFELITGSLPFESDNVMQLLTMKIGRDAPTLTSIAGREFPPELEAVMAQALARRADMRFRSASEFVGALKAATHYAPVSWRPGVMRSTLHSGQHVVERHPTPSIHVQEDAYLPDDHGHGADDAHDFQDEQHEHDEHEEEDETTRDTQRSLPGRRTVEAYAGWTGSDWNSSDSMAHARTRPDDGLRMSEPSAYRVSTRARRGSPWPRVAGFSVLAAGMVALGMLFADGDATNTAHNAATALPPTATAATNPTPAPPTAAVNDAPATTTLPAAAAATEPPRAQTTTTAMTTAPTTPPSAASTDAARSATAATAAPTQALAAPAALAPPLSATHDPKRAPEAPAIKAATRTSAELAPPEPFAPEPVHSEAQVAPSAGPEVLIVKQDTSEPTPEAPVHDAARAKQLTQQATSALLRGEIGRAVELLNEATDVDPSQAPAWRTLGVALERAGSAPAAIEAYQRYLKLAPSGLQAEMVRERMQALEQ